MADWLQKINEEIKMLETDFLVSFPTYRLHSKPRSFHDGLWVFSSKDEGHENNSYLSDDVGTRMMIYDKIKSAFSKMKYHPVLIAQFWAPVIIGGKHLLSTSGQPFAVSHLNKLFKKYRGRCEEHVYDVDVNSNFRMGTPASAFLNRLPEIASADPNAYHKADPLLRYAFLECWFKTSFMIPIYCPSQTSSSSDCIGVIQCLTGDDTDIELFNEINMNIKEVGLGVYNVQDRIPYKTINGLKHARDQIQEALKIVCQWHQIALAQVWIASIAKNHGQEETLGLKLTGYNNIDEHSRVKLSLFQDYYDACDLIPVQPGNKLVLKTLQDFEPRFCKHISQLVPYILMGCQPWDTSMGLSICMRSITTGDFKYVFEFLWEDNSFKPILLEKILLEIKQRLPSFKFASGTEIGDKLHVIEVDDFTDKEIKKFDIFQAKRLSPIPEALKEGKKQVAVDYIAPLGTKYKPAPVLTPQQVIEQQFGTSTTENFHAAENNFGDCDAQRLSDFLETLRLPTYILHKKPETEGALWVFCSKDEGSQNNSSSDDLGSRMIHEKIKSAFSKVKNDEELIIQFWAPVASGNRRVLSTSGQPFAMSDFCEGLEDYRRCCVGYECNIDMNNNDKVIKDEIEQQGDRHPMTMISGPPTNVFLNRLPEAVLDTRIHRVGSLMRYASNCGLWTSYTLPIGCPSQDYSSCIGVVECSSISSINLEIVNTMNRALEQEDLNVFNLRDRIPYNTKNGLEVRDGIQVALKIVCDTHKIGVAQVWISYEDENHVPFSFSSEDTQTTRRLALKLTGYNSVNEDSTASHWRFKEYYDACDMVPLKTGEELVEKTLQDYKPRFCENISHLGTDKLMAWVSTDDVACSGFTIGMNTDTGDFSCAFEFIWHHNPDCVLFLEALLVTLKRHLPCFKFASGAELGDQLHVIDVDNSTERDTKFFKLFKKRTTKEITLSREEIEKHYGKTEKQAAKDLLVSLATLKRKRTKLGMPGWQGPDSQRGRAYNSNKNQSNESHTREKDNGVIQDPSPIKRNENTVIKAEYADDKIILHLAISEATFVTIKNEIGERFKLEDGTFKIKFLDEDKEWILMDSDHALRHIKNSRNVDRSAVQLRVLLHDK